MPRQRGQGSQEGRPLRVRDPLFVEHPEFFDGRDLVQVKYEMLRRHFVEGLSVAEAARRFGFSRQTFYTTAARFFAHRILGLVPGRPGPKGPRKVTEEMAAFFRLRRREDPGLELEALAAEAGERFGIHVHPRTVRRVLGGRKKKPRRPPPLADRGAGGGIPPSR